MATVLKETAKARAKAAKPLDAAALVMTGLREKGWRVVPFPPLKNRDFPLKANGISKKAKTKGKGKSVLITVEAKRGPGRPRKIAA